MFYKLSVNCKHKPVEERLQHGDSVFTTRGVMVATAVDRCATVSQNYNQVFGVSLDEMVSKSLPCKQNVKVSCAALTAVDRSHKRHAIFLNPQ